MVTTTRSAASTDLLNVAGLKTWFPFGHRWLGRRRWLRAVDGVELTVHRDEILAVVGESGSGKTTLGRSLLRLLEPTAGTIYFEGVNLHALKSHEPRAMRRRMQIVFQDPDASLSHQTPDSTDPRGVASASPARFQKPRGVGGCCSAGGCRVGHLFHAPLSPRDERWPTPARCHCQSAGG